MKREEPASPARTAVPAPWLESLPAAPRILIVKPSSLGDIVHTLPVLPVLKAAFPGASLGWLANTEWVPLLLGHPLLDEVIAFPRREFRGLAGGWRAWRWMRETLSRQPPDLVLDFQGLARSALLSRATQAPLIVGFREARELAWLAYHRRIPVPGHKAMHAVHRYLRLLEGLGLPAGGEPEFLLGPGEPLPEDWLPLGEEPLVVLHPFSRGQGKSLSHDEVRSFCGEVTNAGARVALVGSPAENFDAGSLPPGVADLLGRTSLGQLVELLRAADWTVSVDSGPMHLAAALSGRVLSLHTWTDPGVVGPCRPDAWIWRDSRLIQMKDLKPGEFPEQRHRRGEWPVGGPLLPPGTAAELARFVLEKLRDAP